MRTTSHYFALLRAAVELRAEHPAEVREHGI